MGKAVHCCRHTCQQGLQGLQQGGAGATAALRLALAELGGQQQEGGGAFLTEQAAAQPAVMPRPPQCPGMDTLHQSCSQQQQWQQHA